MSILAKCAVKFVGYDRFGKALVLLASQKSFSDMNRAQNPTRA